MAKHPSKTMEARRQAMARQRAKPGYWDRYNAWYRTKMASDPEWAAKRRNQKKSLKGRYKQLLSQARYKGRECSITYEEYLVLVAQPCRYCGDDLSPFGHGLDRVDSSAGYHPNNVVPCCGICNRVKGEVFTYTEMLALGDVIRGIRSKRRLSILRYPREVQA